MVKSGKVSKIYNLDNSEPIVKIFRRIFILKFRKKSRNKSLVVFLSLGDPGSNNGYQKPNISQIGFQNLDTTLQPTKFHFSTIKSRKSEKIGFSLHPTSITKRIILRKIVTKKSNDILDFVIFLLVVVKKIEYYEKYFFLVSKNILKIIFLYFLFF